MPCSRQASSTEWNDAIGQPTQPSLKSRKTRIVVGHRLMTTSTSKYESIAIGGLHCRGDASALADGFFAPEQVARTFCGPALAPPDFPLPVQFPRRGSRQNLL